ncbi:MAG TPA: Rha family transcriptional regulator [Allocoleopsis sp.]
MLELVYVNNDQIWTDSKILADVFGKRHDHVIEKIEKQLAEYSEEFVSTNFSGDTHQIQIGEYGQTRESKIYRLTRDGFMAIGMTMTGKKSAQFREKVLQAFNAMEKALVSKQKPTDILSILKMATVEIESEQRLRLVAEADNKHLNIVIDNSKIGPNDIGQLDRVINSRAAILHETLGWEGPVYRVSGFIKRIIKARFAGARTGATFKEIAVRDFEDCLQFVENITPELIETAKLYPHTDNGLEALKGYLLVAVPV